MPEINTGDTAWVLASMALVMLMTPGLGFFYGGLVRKKNVLSTIMHSFFILCLISIVWALWGFTLAFGEDRGGIIGGFDYLGLKNVGGEPHSIYGVTIPFALFMLFQMMFAIITAALITGAFAERKRFKAFALFAILWSTFVYSPIAHWVWAAGGWLADFGALDFAGGTVVHIASGVSALVAAKLLGKRVGFGQEKMDPHDVTMTVLGAGLLWFGWYGFNAGSALGANGLAANAAVVTTLAAAMGALTWMTVSWWRHGHPSVLGVAVGAIAGLVGITPAAGFVSPASSIAIGFGAGLICFFAVDLLKEGAGIDDALDVFAVHGVGGIWGAIATGIFAKQSINGIGADGLLYGNAGQLWKQIVAVGATILYAAIASFVILKVIDLLIGLRVNENEEVLGLDSSQHGEVAYQL
ncbi:MAG: ammonium transporter [Thermomicrobiales bacterium]|nr:ammonium transporter [Thermomicrobiales bacterium]